MKGFAMREETDSVDLFTAFAIGAMIGVGATLLLRPDTPTPSEQILNQLRPMGKRMRTAARRAGRQYSRTIAETRKAGREMSGAGKEALEELRDQVEDLLSSARNELSNTARRRLKTARRALKRRLS
jgi:gas vesicle protein